MFPAGQRLKASIIRERDRVNLISWACFECDKLLDIVNSPAMTESEDFIYVVQVLVRAPIIPLYGLLDCLLIVKECVCVPVFMSFLCELPFL